MIVVLKHGVEAAKRTQLIDWLKAQGLVIHISEGEYQTVLGLVGDTTNVDMDLIGEPGHRRLRQAGDRALQVLQPQVPPGGHRGRGRAT